MRTTTQIIEAVEKDQQATDHELRMCIISLRVWPILWFRSYSRMSKDAKASEEERVIAQEGLESLFKATKDPRLDCEDRARFNDPCTQDELRGCIVARWEAIQNVRPGHEILARSKSWGVSFIAEGWVKHVPKGLALPLDKRINKRDWPGPHMKKRAEIAGRIWNKATGSGG